MITPLASQHTMENHHDQGVQDAREKFRRLLVDQLMLRVNMFTSANEQIQTFLFSVHGGGLVAALAFLSSERGKSEVAWLSYVLALLVVGVVFSGAVRALVYFISRKLMVAMGEAIQGFASGYLNEQQALKASLPPYLTRLGHIAFALGVLDFALFLVALWITVKNLLLPHL